MGAWQSYRLRLERRRWRLRARRKRRELSAVADRTAAIRPGAILAFAAVRNEHPRLAHFLRYYRDLGVDHFLMVDNASEDATAALLAAEPDVSLWATAASYKRSRFGADWLTWLRERHGHGHWCLTLDADEFLVYPFCDTRPLAALTDWLDASATRSFGAMLLDTYPAGPIEAAAFAPGEDPLAVAPWFDAGNYTARPNPLYGNLWIQGGPRARAFFADAPERAPALNKIPLVKWHRRYAYVSSTHMLLPRGLNRVHDDWGGEKASGCLLHPKFVASFAEKSAEELRRREHYAASHEYRSYASGLESGRILWTAASRKYAGWRQLDELGLLSSGGWA